MKAKDLQIGDILVDRQISAEPTRIAEIDHDGGGPDNVMVRLACQDEWFCYDENATVTIQ